MVLSNEHLITLNVHFPRDKNVHSMQFDNQILIADLCQQIQQYLPIKLDHDQFEYGLFIDESKGYWLEPSKTLNYYPLKNGDHMEYKNKYRSLKIRLLDGTVKTILIDDSLIVQQLMVYICTKFGIANYDEYSLVYDVDADDGQQSTKTATLRRDRSLQRTDKKMEELRRKCHTDDDTLWLDQSKTLRQQDIDEQSTVILRRKYFFSDTNIDQRDPVQLNLLYVQCRNGILDGTHPVTYDEAIQFAGLQCQIQLGDYDESKHKPDIIDTRDFLPKEYLKTKNLEKRISVEHKKHLGLNELDGKVKYTQLCRSLRTYGVTFFLVKEKMSGKNKLVPRLLGVTKDSIVRVDERTKDFLEVWPLTHVKRWTASANTFTLDFGDYASAYYSVQTNEGQQISQLIAGYIDIILKKRKDRDCSVENIAGDEEATMIEDIIAPGKATIIQPNRSTFGYVQQKNVYSPPVIRGTFSDGANGYATSHIYDSANVFSTIEGARNTLNTIQSYLQFESSQPRPSKSDRHLESIHHFLTTKLSTINASTAQIIILTSDIYQQRNFDYSTALSSITTNLQEFCQEIVHLANQPNILDQTHRLCSTFHELLISIENFLSNHSDSTLKQNLLLSASYIGEINQDFVRNTFRQIDISIDYQEKLLSLAKSVANTTAVYVLKAKDIATNLADQLIINEMISTATQCALATSQLVACTKVVVATITSPLCQEQLIESARNVTRSIESVLQSCSPPRIHESFFQQLNEAGRVVRKTLNEFLLHIKLITEHNPMTMNNNNNNTLSKRLISNDDIDEQEEIEEEEEEEKQLDHDQSIEQIIHASDRLFSSVGDAAEMVRQAKILAQATAQLVSSLRQQAESVDDDTNQQKKFLAAAKMLADATAKMVESAKGCATKPTDHQLQYQLKKSVEELRLATNLATSSPIKRKIFQRVEQCAKHCASCATQCIAATSTLTIHPQRSHQHQELIQQCKIVADLIPKIVQAIRTSMIKPDSYAYQNNLLYSCEDFLSPATYLINLAETIVPTIDDQTQAGQLNQSSKQLTQALNELRACLNRAQELINSTGLDIDGINEMLDLFEKELTDIQRQVNDGYLRIKSDEFDACSTQFASICKQMNAIVSQIDYQNNESDIRDLLQMLRKFLNSTRHLAGTCNDLSIQNSIVEHARVVLQRTLPFLRELKRSNPSNLSSLSHDLSLAIHACISNMPSQRYLNEAIKQMSEVVYVLSTPMDNYSMNSSMNSDDINRAAANLNQATNDLVLSTNMNGQQDLAKTSVRFSRAFGDFFDNSLHFLHQQQEDDEKRSRLLISLKNVHTKSNLFLERAKSVSIEPVSMENDPKHQLANAARAVTETINDVINACLVPKSPVMIERIECDNAIRDMELAKNTLQQPVVQPTTTWTYFETLDHVVDNSKRLGEAMTHIASASKNTNHQLFLQAIQETTAAVCSLVQSSAQASYLVGIADVSSTKGTVAVLDQTLFTRSVTAIRHACADLTNPACDRNDILTHASAIAKNTSILCNISRDVSINTTNQLARKHFIQSAKDVANGTAELVRKIKVLDSSYTQENHRQCTDISRHLLQSIDDLYNYAMSKEFASIPATISSNGRQLQEPILSSARNVVDGACRIIDCSKSLISNSKEASLWQQLATHTKTVSEAIKRLATSVKEMTPGQQDCERAVEELRKLFQQIDRSIMNVDTLPKSTQSFQFHQEQISCKSHSLIELIPNLRQVAKQQCEQISNHVSQFINHLQPCIQHTTDYISILIHKHEKILLLEQVKAIIEISLQLILSTKECGGNVKNTQWHKILDNNCDLFIKSIEKLVQRFEEENSLQQTMKTITDNIQKLISTLDTTMISNQGQFIEYQCRMVEVLKNLSQTIQTIHQTEQIRSLGNRLSTEYNDLVNATYGAIGTSITHDLAGRIRHVVKELGVGLIEFIEKLGGNYTKQDLESLLQKILEKISHVLTTLQVNVRGTQACVHAASTVSGIIADLDTTILFATAGSLNAEQIDETFADHREAILKTAKALVEDTKTLVAGAASSQEQLASAAQAAVRTITKLAEVVKLGAASLGANDGEAQVMLINSVKDVALALNNLIGVTKSASGKKIDDPEMQKLKESAKTMVTNVTSLLRTVKTVEDETQRGTNALETTIESISQELHAFNNGQSTIITMKTTPEELIRVTKQITIATSKAVSASQTCQQEDIITTVNFARKAIVDLLNICKSSVSLTDDQLFQQRLLDNGQLCVKTYRELLETLHILIQKPSNEAKQKLINCSRVIAQTIQELVLCAEQLKGTDFADPDDPTYIAENELFTAAQTIESAAKKLASLKPRRQIKEINDNLNFDEQILEAAKSIMNAASALITAATSAQKELVAQGKLSSKSTFDDDGQWSQGLISAARYVASACHVLCEAANGLVQGNCTEEKLISSAKQVSSNTAALLVACKVKADFMSQSMTRLQTAGNAVKRAADALVRSAQQAVDSKQEDKQIEVSTRFVPGIAQEIKCKEAILTKERELDEARNRLKAIRLAKYGHNESESNDST